MSLLIGAMADIKAAGTIAVDLAYIDKIR